MPRCSLRAGEASAGGGDAGFRVAGDGGVAIEDEIAVWRDAGGIDLGAWQGAQGRAEDDGRFADEIAELMRGRNANSWRARGQASINGHGGTSELR